MKFTGALYAASAALLAVPADCSFSNIRGGASSKLSSLEQIVDPLKDVAGMKRNTRQVQERKLQSGLAADIFESQVNRTHAFPMGADPDCAAGQDMIVGVTKFNIEGIYKNGTKAWSNSLRWLFEPLVLEIDAMVTSPHVIYDSDPARNVFVVAATLTDKKTFSKIVVAVSRTSMPMSGTSEDWFYVVVDSFDMVANVGNTFADDIGLALDGNAIYLTGAMKLRVSRDEDEFVHSKLWILAKNPLLDLNSDVQVMPGQPLVADMAQTDTILKSETILSLDGDKFIGPYYPATMENDGSKVYGKFGTYLVAYNVDYAQGDDEELHVIRVVLPVAEAGPTLTEYIVNIGDIDDTTSPLATAPQPDADYSGVETGDRKVQDVAWYNEKLYVTLSVLDGNGQTSAYWLTIDADSTATAPTSLSLDSTSGSSGYINLDANTATYFPSVAVNMNSDVLVGFGASGTSRFSGMYAQLASSGVAEELVAGEANLESIDGLTYHGSYSGASVDPSDKTCFWLFNTFSRTTSLPEEIHLWARGGLATGWAKVCPSS